MASIKKLKNGTYQATISCGRDANEKQIRKYVTKPTLKECKSAVRELELQIEAGLMVNKNIKLAFWMDEWLELNKNRLAPSTYMSYKLYINTHFKPILGNLKLLQINEIHLKRYINDKLESLSPTTIRKHIFVLRKILQDALKDKNPAKDIDIPKKEDFKPHIVSDEEFQLLHTAVKGTSHEPIILLGAWCGLRRGEIFALKWNDIDYNNGTIKVDENFALSEDGYIDKKPKSSNGTRVVAAPQYLIDLLNEKRKKQKNIYDRIFKGRPDNYTHQFKKLLEKNNLNKIRFHDLRHYHASFLYKNNVPDLHAAERLGHDIQTLKKIYQHIDVETKRENDKNIVNLINNSNK